MAVNPDTMITQIETFLQSGIGIASIRHPDGRTITMDRDQAMKELGYWKSLKATQQSSGLVMSRLGLSGDA